jgi:hypothetical protein
MTFSIMAECYYAECRYADFLDLFIDMPNVIMLIVVMLSVMVAADPPM